MVTCLAYGVPNPNFCISSRKKKKKKKVTTLSDVSESDMTPLSRLNCTGKIRNLNTTGVRSKQRHA